MTQPTAIPPKPASPPTIGTEPPAWSTHASTTALREDLIAFATHLGQVITETPEDRKERQRAEREAAHKAAGETPEQRKARHKAEAKRAKHTAAARNRRAGEGASGRASRFRRWCILTTISASGGYAIGLVQWAATGGPYAGLLLAAGGYALDLRVRYSDTGIRRISEVRGAPSLIALIACRVPVASGLAVALQIDGLLAALPL